MRNVSLSPFAVRCCLRPVIPPPQPGRRQNGAVESKGTRGRLCPRALCYSPDRALFYVIRCRFQNCRGASFSLHVRGAGVQLPIDKGSKNDSRQACGEHSKPGGMGVTKAHCCSAKRIGLYDSPLPGKALPLELWRERLARGLIDFFLALSCSPLAAAHPKTWQPPKASRSKNHNSIFPSLFSAPLR